MCVSLEAGRLERTGRILSSSFFLSSWQLLTRNLPLYELRAVASGCPLIPPAHPLSCCCCSDRYNNTSRPGVFLSFCPSPPTPFACFHHHYFIAYIKATKTAGEETRRARVRKNCKRIELNVVVVAVHVPLATLFPLY